MPTPTRRDEGGIALILRRHNTRIHHLVLRCQDVHQDNVVALAVIQPASPQSIMLVNIS